MVAAALAKNIVPESREALRAAFTAVDDRLAALEAATPAGSFFARAATTGALAAYTRVGSVYTADANGALGAIDGVTLVVGDKFWLKNGAAAADHALVDVTSLGAGGAKYVLTRNAEWDAAVGPGAKVFVSEGTVNGNKSWTITTDTNPIVPGTTAITFVLDPDAAALAATTGSAAIGHDAEATVKAGLDACARAATLAAAGGAALVGSAVGGLNVEQRLAATEAVANAGMATVEYSVTIAHDHATLAANAVNGAASVINIGAVPAANSRVVAYNVTGTPLTGGGAVSLALDIGTAGDPDAIVAAADVLTAFVDGCSSTLPAGIAPHKQVGATQLIATLTPDGAHNLAGLDAGSITIDVVCLPLA